MQENNNGEKWVESFDKDFTITNDLGGHELTPFRPMDYDKTAPIKTIWEQTPEDIKTFIRLNFIHKDDLIGLVEGVIPEYQLHPNHNEAERYEISVHNGVRTSILAALKDTLSNQP